VPTNKKNYAAGIAISHLPPRKTAGRRYAPQAKKSPQRATISVSVPNWWDFTPKSEPISEKICKAEPQRQAGATRPLRPSNTPQIIFLQLLL